MALKDLEKNERPRERAARTGVSSLSDRELVAALLGTGTSGSDALETATRLLGRGLAALASAGVRELVRERGLGPAGATRIAAAFELGRRLEGSPGSGCRVASSEDLARVARARLGHERQEVLVVVLLTARLAITRIVEVARGSLCGASFTPADVLAPALREGAPRLALAHNHPSGDPRPSAADAHATARLLAASRTLGIDVVDHVIVGGAVSGGGVSGRERVFSFNDAGLFERRPRRRGAFSRRR